MTIDIRAYEPSDWEAICAIHDQARPLELEGSCAPEAFVPLHIAAHDEDLFESVIAVATRDGEVVGFVATRGAYISWLYVSPSHHRQGVGRALCEHALEACGPDVWVETLAGNGAALGLYRAHGFEVVSSMEVTIEGHPARCVKLCLGPNE